MRSKQLLLSVLFLYLSIPGQAQGDIQNTEIFSTFLDTTENSLLIIGENHSSSVGSTILPKLITYLNKENGLTNLLIEFGPSEAYFYTQFLKTGDTKWLRYTVNGTYYVDWQKAWQAIYEHNKTLDKPIQIRGIDFDRGRTFGYALYNIFKGYDARPSFVDTLMNQIKSQEFYKTHTIGYPTDNDLKFVKSTRSLLIKHQETLKELLDERDYYFINQMIKNEALDYGENREENITANTKRIISNLDDDDYLLMIGRSHAYRKPIYGDESWLVERLSKDTSINSFTGVILHENSQQWGKDYKTSITLHEVRDKKPWKEYAGIINKQASSDLSVVPLQDDLEPLSSYTDFIIVARNKKPIEVVQ